MSARRTASVDSAASTSSQSQRGGEPVAHLAPAYTLLRHRATVVADAPVDGLAREHVNDAAGRRHERSRAGLEAPALGERQSSRHPRTIAGRAWSIAPRSPRIAGNRWRIADRSRRAPLVDPERGGVRSPLETVVGGDGEVDPRRLETAERGRRSAPGRSRSSPSRKAEVLRRRDRDAALRVAFGSPCSTRSSRTRESRAAHRATRAAVPSPDRRRARSGSAASGLATAPSGLSRRSTVRHRGRA